YPWMSVDYRLHGSLRVADAADDVRAAVAFARCHAGDLGIDPDRIVLLGEDAGAALAVTVAERGAPGVIGAVLLGGLFADAPDEASSAVAPGLQSRRPDLSPRFLVVHGTSDTEVPIARAEAWCRQRAADTCELLAIEGASHRPENWWPVHWGYKSRLAEWLQRVAPVSSPQPAAAPPTDLSMPLAPGLHKRIPYRPNEGGSTKGVHLKVDTTREAEPRVGAAPSTVDGQTMDAWLPPDRATRRPAVVLLHGGGWEAGDRVTYITPLFEPLARAGFAWFSVDYRLTPAVRHPDQLDDVRAALAFIRTHAAAFRIDASRLVLVGESASAQMATLLAGDGGLAGVVSFYGVYDFLPMVTDAGPRSLAARLFGRTALDDEARALLRRYSPLHQARRDMAPILLIHGTSERLWDQGVRMAARLAEIGVEHELVRLDGAPHGMENWEGHTEWQFYKPHLVSWIERQISRQRSATPGRR
ncbi:MAG TPA: alpha/beta hydrolase fold domain-containing protein, partial [Vicinamibacterales bacterium]|nr:alpha/beta hydrolase fold domain-containing protein [Vicinamibacterales bacterium]